MTKFVFDDDEINPQWDSLFPNPFERKKGAGILEHSFIRMMRLFIDLPEPKIQFPIVGAYLLSCSDLLRQAKHQVPYLFSYGRAGSGKSTLAKLCGAIHDINPASSVSSAAGIRQSINSHRKNGRLCYFFLWDDVNVQTFRGEGGSKIYSMLKNGYDPGTSLVSMGGLDGSEDVFDVYGLKVFSSIFPLHQKSEFQELTRRILLIQHQPNPSFSPENPLDWNWDGLSKTLEEFWQPQGEGHIDFAKARKAIHNRFKGDKETILPSNERTVFKGILASGCATGIFEDVDEAIEHARLFYAYQLSAYSQGNDLNKWLIDHITANGKNAVSVDSANCRVHFFPSKDVFTGAEQAYQEGLLINKPSREEIEAQLIELGYALLSKKEASSYTKDVVWLKEIQNNAK